jgi:1,4-dihydroxy-2-naphthoate octaprenyltransferase
MMAVSHVEINFDIKNCVLIFIILHVFIYPASNGYNSTQDKDQGSIGLVEHPKPVPKSLIWITMSFDIIGIASSFFINYKVGFMVTAYVIASRLYSYRKIRLKKYPILGFLTVFIFQGMITYWIILNSLNNVYVFSREIIAAIASSFLIGSIYPLSQVYQHQQDVRDGVYTLSYKLGYIGTFIFSGISFLIGTILLCYYYYGDKNLFAIQSFLLCNIPVLFFFNYWFRSVYKNNTRANFKNTMLMNIVSCLSLLIHFTILITHK